MEQCSAPYGIPEGTIARYVRIGSEFFIAKRKHESMDRHCEKLGIGSTKGDTRTNYHVSPCHDLKEAGFVIPENTWPNLTIDEVNLGGDAYAIPGNPEKNKIVALVPGTKAAAVTGDIRGKIPFRTRLAVREVTLDMPSAMDWIVTGLFPGAKRTLDRFHVTKNVPEDVRSVRMGIKTLIKDGELAREDQCKIERKRHVPGRLGNDETRLDSITRLRYQLFKRRTDWNECQHERWEVLKKHGEFADIVAAYGVLEEFYSAYDSEGTREEVRILWEKWFRKISGYESVKELQNAGRMAKNHLEGVLNYFDHRSTNAFAEWLHSRIRRLISNVGWFKDKHYMLYRIMRIFA